MWSPSQPEISLYKRARSLGSGQTCSTWLYTLRRSAGVSFKPCGTPKDIVVKELCHLQEDDIEAIERLTSIGSNQNVLRYHTPELIGEKTYLKMEAARCNLDELRNAHGGRFKTTDFEFLAQQICDGLRFLHSKDIHHQRVSPRNVLVAHSSANDMPSLKACILKLSDFGFGDILAIAAVQRYSAPEQMRPRVVEMSLEDWKMADTFSSGVVLYEMLAGQVPYTDQELKRRSPPATTLPLKRPIDTTKCVHSMFAACLKWNGGVRSVFWSKTVKQWMGLEIRRPTASTADMERVFRKGMRSLHKASSDGNVAEARWLVESRDDINRTDDTGKTPLHHASRNGHLEIVQLLVEYGSDCNRSNKKGKRPLHLACKGGHLEVVHLLVAEGGKEGITASYQSGGIFTNTPMKIACIEGHLDIVRYFVEDMGADIEYVGKVGMTPLISACWYGQLEVVEFLLQKGARKSMRCNGLNFGAMYKEETEALFRKY